MANLNFSILSTLWKWRYALLVVQARNDDDDDDDDENCQIIDLLFY